MDVLSLWRSPLDRVAIGQAKLLHDRQPRCSSIGYGEDFSAMTIYNFGHYVPMGVPPDTGLTNMFHDMTMASPVGGRAFVPQKSFPVQADSNGFKVPDQCDMDGSGGGGILEGTSGSAFFHFVITPVGPGNSIFLNCNVSGHTAGGMYFRSLSFQWGASTEPTDTCIHAVVWNTRAINCTFTDCPCAFNAQNLTCTLEQCTINYTASAPTGTTAVVLGGQQCGVIGPGQFAQTSPGSGGATGCTCISIESAEHPVVSDMQIYEWTTGIDFSQMDGTRFAHITNCEIECWQTALNIQLSSDLSAITAGIKVTSCVLAKASDSTDDLNAVVNIDARGSSNNGLLNDIALIDCTVCNLALAPLLSPQHGLAITSGSNIRIIGGTYSNNGPGGGAGIAIIGACSDVQIIGVNLQPSYPGASNVNNQNYALLVSESPIGPVVVSGCDMTGYTGSPVSVTGTPSELLINDCPGYNDRSTALSATAGMLTTGVSAATSSSPYFGPSVIIWSGTGLVTLNVFGGSITSSFGIVFLPTPYDLFHFSPVPPSTFLWIGK